MTELSSHPATPDAVETRDRKREHIDLALSDRMQTHGHHFDRWRFVHEALPEIDRAEVDPSTTFLGKPMAMPLLISCMTGGTELAATINRNLAVAAERMGIALGVGSQRKAIEDPSQVPTFQVREQAPSVPLLANLGAVQLNYGFGLDECRRAVEMIDADALVLHLNPLQEALQPEGQCDFRGLLDKIGDVAERLEVPVVVKEVGSGLSEATGRALVARGVAVLDTAGVGGTSWARIEASRSGDLELGELFASWGEPTPESIRQLADLDGATVIGSGGLRHGLDVATALCLGADLAGMAFQFLRAAVDGPEAVTAKIQRTLDELITTMFCTGARNLEDLTFDRLVERRR